MADLKDRLREDLTASMKARDEVRTRTLRMVLTSVSKEEVAGSAARELNDDEVMKVLTQEAKRRREAAEAFAAAGATLIIMGLYFILMRPPLLPEDVRYMALPAMQFDLLKPRLEPWLAHVFQVMGGYVPATGVLTITLAATSFHAHHRGAALGVLVGGAASIGWMAVVNFVINSHFKWLLLGMAALWASSLVVFWFEKNPNMRAVHRASS